jgi:Na+-transporting methylmalonyl-CoA/oxaloacetate decarboxylase gamma subunit
MVAVSEQSRGFGSIVILFLFVLIAVVSAVGCIVGHIVRRAEARQEFGA